MSPSILKATKNTKKMSKTMRKVQRAVNKQVWKIRKGFYYLKRDIQRTAKNVAKVTGAMVTAIGAAGAKIGFSEAFNIEGFRVQLETAVGSAQLAAKKMAYATKFANSTPFETSSVMEATARLEAMGIKSEKWLPKIADMAGATNKSIQQSYEAIIDAVASGELERLKEFGIRKDDLVKATDIKFGAGVVFDSRGSLKDAAKLSEVLMETMDKKFGGGAKKMSTTVKGLWSTMTGVTKTSLANIIGITSDGTIKQGSALDLLKGKMQGIVAKLNEWQNNGTIKKISEGLVKGLKTAATYGKKFSDRISGIIDYLKENEKVVLTVVSAFLGFKAVAVAVSMATKAMALFKIVSKSIKGAMTPMLGFQIVVALLAAGLYLLYRNSESFRKKIDQLVAKVKAFGKVFKKDTLPKITKFGKELYNLANKKIKNFIKWIKSVDWKPFINGLKTIFKWAKKLGKGAFDKISKILNKIDWDMIGQKVHKVAFAFKILGAFAKKYVLPIIKTVGKVLFKSLIFVIRNLIDIFKVFWKKILIPIGKFIYNVLWKKAFQPLGEYIAKIIMPIIKILGLAFAGFIIVLNPLINFLIAVFKPIFIGVFRLIKAYIITFIGTIGGYIKALTRIFTGVIDFVVGVFTGDWKKAWNGVVNIFGGIFDGIKTLITKPIRLAIDIAKEFIDGFTEKFDNLKEKISEVFGFLKEGGKEAFKNTGNFFVDILNGIIEKMNVIEITIPDWFPKIGGKSWGINIPTVPRFATGTKYFSGGLAEINEHGGEIVNLPGGSQVIPADKSEMLIKQSTKNNKSDIKIIIQGDVYGDQAFIDRMFAELVRRLEIALGNM